MSITPRLRSRGFLIRIFEDCESSLAGNELVRPLAVGLHDAPRSPLVTGHAITARQAHSVAKYRTRKVHFTAADAAVDERVVAVLVIVFCRIKNH